MSPPIRWIALGIGAYLVFLVVTFPASVAYRWFAPDGVVLTSPSGTAWSGQAPAAVVGGLPLSELQWRLSPAALLAGRASGTLESRLPDGFGSTQFTATLAGRVSLEDARLSTSIQNLSGLLPVYDTRGQISVSLDRLSIVDGWPETAAGEVRVGDLEVAPLVPTATGAHVALGSFVATVAADGGEIVADLADTSGPLELDGQLTVQPDRTYLLSARVRARPDATPDLREGIELMTGAADSSGLRELNWSGSL